MPAPSSIPPPYDARDAVAELLLDLPAGKMVTRQTGAYPGDLNFASRRFTDGDRSNAVFEASAMYFTYRAPPVANQTGPQFSQGLVADSPDQLCRGRKATGNALRVGDAELHHPRFDACVAGERARSHRRHRRCRARVGARCVEPSHHERQRGISPSCGSNGEIPRSARDDKKSITLCLSTAIAVNEHEARESLHSFPSASPAAATPRGCRPNRHQAAREPIHSSLAVPSAAA